MTVNEVIKHPIAVVVLGLVAYGAIRQGINLIPSSVPLADKVKEVAAKTTPAQ